VVWLSLGAVATLLRLNGLTGEFHDFWQSSYEQGAMKDIEINSDKVTVLAVIFFLVLCLVGFVSNLLALTRHRPEFPDLHFWDYLVAIFNVYAAVAFYHDEKFCKNYPYGVAGICLMALGLLVRIAAHWTKGFPESQSLFWASMTVINIASSSLILAEGVRWFRRKVKLT
jgi:hypothetical protein